jgi:hypothetical protein
MQTNVRSVHSTLVKHATAALSSAVAAAADDSVNDATVSEQLQCCSTEYYGVESLLSVRLRLLCLAAY